MARYVCPCCGEGFNGKKCRSCFYETFDEEISHSLHTHKGEPLVIEAPARRPAARKNPFECDKKTVKRKKMPKWLAWLLVLLLAEPGLLLVETLIDSVGDAISVGTREPVSSVALPEEAALLIQSDGLRVYIQETEDVLRYTLYLENDTEQDVQLSATNIIVDGFVSEQSYGWCEAPAGTTCQGDLWLDAEDLEWSSLGDPGQLEIDFVIYDLETYENLLETHVSMEVGVPAGALFPVEEPELDVGGIQVSCLGFFPDSYDPDVFYDGVLRFYIVNGTSETQSIYVDSALLNGEECDLSLWCELPGETRTVTRMWLFDAEDMGIMTLDQAESLELHLIAYGEESGDTDLGWITVDFSE